jgi:hypothetical protein
MTIQIFWNMSLCHASGSWCSEGMQCSHLQEEAVLEETDYFGLLQPEDEGTTDF